MLSWQTGVAMRADRFAEVNVAIVIGPGGQRDSAMRSSGLGRRAAKKNAFGRACFTKNRHRWPTPRRTQTLPRSPSQPDAFTGNRKKNKADIFCPIAQRPTMENRSFFDAILSRTNSPIYPEPRTFIRIHACIAKKQPNRQNSPSRTGTSLHWTARSVRTGLRSPAGSRLSTLP